MRRFKLLSILSLLLALGLTASAAQQAAAAGSESTPAPTPGPSGHSQTRSLATDDRPRPYDDFTYWTADDCRQPGTAAETTNSSGGGRIVNHFQRCAWKQQAVTLWAPNQIYPLGTIMFRLTMMARAAEDGRTIEVAFRADEIHASNRRKLLADMTYMSMTPSCSADKAPATCSMTPSTRQTISLPDLEATGLTFTFQSPRAPTTQNPISKDFGHVSFAYYFTSPPVGQQIDQVTGGIQEFSMDWRCDSAQLTRSEFKKEACVFPTLPHLTYNINDAGITESAQHIRQAQEDPNSTYPKPPENGSKTIPNKVTRHWDAQLNANQRAASRAACEAAPVEKPAGTDCDEYPFASTREGSLAPPLPNYNFSVKYIKSGDNRRSGCWMGLWLVKDRVLAEDQYQVDVFDGPVFPEPPAEPPECAEEEQ